MSYDFIARFRIRPEKEAEFLDLVPPMEANSREEPGTLFYKFYRLEEPGMFAVFESFVDEAADEAHRNNPANADLIAGMIGCMDGTYTREFLLPLKRDG